MKREPKAQGAQAFEAYYSALYGERWPRLKEALAGPSKSLALRVLEGGGYETLAQAKEGLPLAWQEGPGPYFLDEASVAAAASLTLPPAGQVLDACAAPGGKSLVLAARLSASSRLLCNELSPDRRRRLSSVLDSCLPGAIRQRISVMGADASSLCLRRPGAFDAILLDAPCSSERHVLADPAALAEWSPSRPASLARRQWALLSSAFLMLAPGGSLVYSTCSLDPGENDGVASRLVAKHGKSLEILPVGGPGEEIPGSEPTELGRIVLPDLSGGGGPMYIFRIRRL